MTIQELHDTLLSEGCNRFFIQGIGGPQDDDVEHLGFNGDKWEVYYSERGQRSSLIFATSSEAEAIEYYYEHVIKQEHWHLVVFTRSPDVFNSCKIVLEKNNVKIIQNDIPNYSKSDDRVFRLFVTNKDIFVAQKLLEIVPYYDEDFKRLFF
jgi:hypothetical protein